MSETFEEWRHIRGYENIYMISSLGNVKVVKTGKLRKLANDKDGYLSVNLSKDGQQSTKKVHRLVAHAFLPECELGRHQINHKDANRKNNKVNNLEWVTPFENSKHRELMKNELKGVYKRKETGRWLVQVRHNNNVTNHGYYDSREVAISVYYKKFKEITGYYPFESELVNHQQKKLDQAEARVRELEDLIATNDFPKKSDECTTCQYRRKIILDLSKGKNDLTKERDELARALTIAEGFIDDSHLSSAYSKCVEVQRGKE